MPISFMASAKRMSCAISSTSNFCWRKAKTSTLPAIPTWLSTEAGTDVTLQIGEGLPHVYQLLLGTPEAAQATEQIGKFLQARVRSPHNP